jgi:hypothetical protein
MKRMLFVALVVTLTSAWTGCNRGWPGCFCRDNDAGDYAVSDACGCDPSDVCEPSGARYTTSSPTVEYVQPAIPTPSAEPVPMPNPATTMPSR